MAIAIKTENIDGKPVEKYRLWSNNTTDWLSDWLTREEMIKHLFWQKFYDFVDAVIKDEMTFPHHYSRKDNPTTIIVDKEKANAYFKCKEEIFDAEDYENALLGKFTEIAKAYDIKLKVSEGEFNFDTEEKEEE